MIRQIAVKVLSYISGAIMRLQLSTHLTITVVNLKTIKDIAFMITSELSWTIYCNMITARAYKQVGIRCRTFSINCMPGKTVLYSFSKITVVILLAGMATTSYSKESNIELRSTYILNDYI